MDSAATRRSCASPNDSRPHSFGGKHDYRDKNSYLAGGVFAQHPRRLATPNVRCRLLRKAQYAPYRSPPEPMAMTDVGGKPVNWMLRQESPRSSHRWIHAELSTNRVFPNPRKSVIYRVSVNEKASLPECNNATIRIAP